MNQKIIARADEIINKKAIGGSEGYCTLALIDTDGYPTASTISISKADGIRWLTFCTEFGPGKAERISKCNRASVCINSADYNITLVGTIDVSCDPNTKSEMWYEGLENHFSGVDDPNYCVLRFKTERYNLWVDWQEARGTLQA
ncbi:MAG TPA: pyridoxamine 5'-phosphate oxidase family protein [Clostridia bacterium]|jgi:general stress protein 26|nr:pyridoxamine 5'-phosphate oxidase family protein [Clostridia bacterium]